MDHELETMKSQIMIADLAQEYGYTLDRRASCKVSLLLRNDAQASKIVVATDATDGHSVFFEVHGRASGSVVDFVMWVEGVNLGHARRVLRAKLNAPACTTPIFKPEPTTVTTAHLYAAWESLQAYQPGYLEGRGIVAGTIALFASEVRTDRRGNTVFRHRDRSWHLCGWEAKNVDFTGFSAGGQKGLFVKLVGVPAAVPACVIVAESAVDALSYYQASGQEGLYLSFAGGLSEHQTGQLVTVLNRYPSARVVIATDNDAQGAKYAELLKTMRSDAVRALPPVGKDWNDVVRGVKGA